jgi:hypothetical protein
MTAESEGGFCIPIPHGQLLDSHCFRPQPPWTFFSNRDILLVSHHLCENTRQYT